MVPVFIISVRKMLHLHPSCRAAAEACVGTQEFWYPRDLGALVSDFHQKPRAVPVTCPGAGKEPVAVQERNLKVAKSSFGPGLCNAPTEH